MEINGNELNLLRENYVQLDLMGVNNKNKWKIRNYLSIDDKYHIFLIVKIL